MKNFDPRKTPSTKLPQSIDLPFKEPIGNLFNANGRIVTLERVHDDEVVDLRDRQTGGLLQVRDPETGQLVAPTISWMRDMFGEGLLHAIGEPESLSAQQGRFALLDPAACEQRDPKSPWRRSLAWRALEAGIDKTDAAAGEWLDANYGTLKKDLDYRKPSPSSLRRWMRALEKGKKRPGALVSQIGRAPGSSQLDAFLNGLVHEAAVWFWATKRATKADAYAWLFARVEEANANLRPGQAKHKLPSKETLRKRIERLRCWETVRAKEGEQSAAKLYKGSGEPILVDRLLEIVLCDATALEQVIVFDEAWQLPACRIRITAFMDGASHAIIGWHVYAGPNRNETTMQALISCMTPSPYPEDVLAMFPDLKWLYGKPASILPDNEKALIGPSSLPGLNDAGIALVEPAIETPTAKASLERFWRTMKEALKALPGTIIDPKHAVDLDYDGVKAATLILPQLREMVARVIATHNISESKGLDGRSPMQVWMSRMGNRATPAFEDPTHVKRCLARHFRALCTRDGIEFDGIRYRESTKVKTLLSHNANTAPRRSQRKDGSATYEVSVRRNDGNIDTIQVLDELTGEWVELPSTHPQYTHNLSAWEHDVFRKAAKKRRESFKTQRDRLLSKAMTIRKIEELCPKQAFQQRRTMAALYQNVVVDKLAGGIQPAMMPGLSVPQITGDDIRLDKRKGSVTPERANPTEDDWDSAEAADAADAEAGTRPIDDDAWEAAEVDEGDAETGREPADEDGEEAL